MVDFVLLGKRFASTIERASPFYNPGSRGESLTDINEAQRIYIELRNLGLNPTLRKYDVPKDITKPNRVSEVDMSYLDDYII